MTKIKLEDLVRVTKGGRVTIPIRVRKEKGIEAGDHVWIIVKKPSFEGPKEKIDKEGEKQK